MQRIGRAAREASRVIARSPVEQRNRALDAIADAIAAESKAVLDANAQDLARARENALDAALLDRLELTPDRIEAMLEGLAQVVNLADPIGAIEGVQRMPSGIDVGTMRVPLGVIGIIYESRPNVTIDAAALCLKAGNAVILRGGSEAIESNTKHPCAQTPRRNLSCLHRLRRRPRQSTSHRAQCQNTALWDL